MLGLKISGCRTQRVQVSIVYILRSQSRYPFGLVVELGSHVQGTGGLAWELV